MNHFIKKMIIIPLIFFFTSLGNDAFRPFLPLYFLSLGGTPEMVGLVFSISGVIAILSLIPSGYLADKYGRRKMFLSALIFALLSSVIFLSATNYLFVILGMLTFSIAGSIAGPAALAMISELTPEKKRGEAFGTMDAIILLGSAGAPLIGGYFVSVYGFRAVFYWSTLTSLIAFSIAQLHLKETVHDVDKKDKRGEKSFYKSVLAELASSYLRPVSLLKNTFVLMTILFISITLIGEKMIEPYVSLYAVGVAQIPIEELGVLFSFLSILTAAISYVGGKTADAIGINRVIVLSIIGTFLIAVFIPIYPSAFILLLPLLILFSNIRTPSINVLLTNLTDHNERATMVGTTYGLGTIAGVVIGPLLGASLYGLSPPFLFSMFASLQLINIFLVFLLLFKIKTMKQKAERI